MLIRRSNKKYKSNNKPYILAEKVEERVQKIKNGLVRSFFRGFLEGVEDSLVDLVYVVALTLDDYYETQRQAIEDARGPERTIEVFPNASNTDESFIIQEPQSEIIQTVGQQLNTYALIHNRDIGVVVGQPYSDWYTSAPQGRKLLLEYDEKPEPPFRKNGQRTKRIEVSIPDAKSGISWQLLKNTCPKFTWGPHFAKGVFANSRRYMGVWGVTENEALNTLQKLSTLSKLEIIKSTTSSTKIEDPNRKKRPKEVHLVYATLLVRKKTENGNTTTIDGQNIKMSKIRWEMWHATKPENIEPFP